MRELVGRGQLELLTGSYYEAILAIIPEADRIGQVRKLSDTIHKLFNYVPRGMWLAERVWEPQLVGSVASAGVEFVVVDDSHFRQAGLNDEQLLGYYITEDQGAMLKVIPIDKTLRYTIPFRAIDETRHYLQNVAADHKGNIVVHADDGEKFGVWPKTYAEVFKKGWLKEFCAFLEENRSWVQTIHLAQVIDEYPSRARVYLPTASYTEMMKWVLPATPFLQFERFEKQLNGNGFAEEAAMFVRGGFWRNFLAKYPEANHMHKKMLRVAKRVRTLEQKKRIGNEIYDHLWAGQCNDPYWHGVFGGLYLPNLRFPVYHHLLKAEGALDRMDGSREIKVEKTDFDCDGKDEILIESKTLNLYIKPSDGGTLVELDYKPAAFNLLDIISRREEGYHRRLMATRKGQEPPGQGHEELVVKELGLEKHLHFDWYRHASLVDHFFATDTTLESFSQCKYLEEGDFVNQPYDGRVVKKGREVTVTLSRDGAVWRDGVAHHLRIEKHIRYRDGDSRYVVDYELTNCEPIPLETCFGVEFNVGLMAGDAHDRSYDIEGRMLADRRLRSTGAEAGVSTFRLVDEWLGLETGFRLSTPATLWRCPIETVSLSEAGLERVYQSSTLVPHWKLRLVRSFSVRIEQYISKRASDTKRSIGRRTRSKE
jgi:alpha-amylase